MCVRLGRSNWRRCVIEKAHFGPPDLQMTKWPCESLEELQMHLARLYCMCAVCCFDMMFSPSGKVFFFLLDSFNLCVNIIATIFRRSEPWHHVTV